METNKLAARHKAYKVYATGETFVEKELAADVMEELEKHNGTYYAALEMGGLVLIQKADY